MAITCLSKIMDQDQRHDHLRRKNLFPFSKLRGYLQCHIEAICAEDDAKLQRVLTDIEADMRPFYIYLARMAFLSTLASSESGGAYLVQLGAINGLANCRCFGFVPASAQLWHNETNDDGTQSLASRYEYVFSAALNFCLSAIIGTGNKNIQTMTQMIHFLVTNQDIFNLLFQSFERSDISLVKLKLQEKAVAAITQCLSAGNLRDIPNGLKMQISMFGRSLFRLLPRVCRFPDWIREATDGKCQSSRAIRSEVLILLTVGHVIRWCANKLPQLGGDPSFQLMFMPSYWGGVKSSDASTDDLFELCRSCYAHCKMLSGRQSKFRKMFADLKEMSYDELQTVSVFYSFKFVILSTETFSVPTVHFF
ncbi:unnamed protein product [Soboliphyme baturini]|uniref:FPL domain-containing protein n=1 Tax=Soboliphyme baturini TaxID=241478 RepID=A0A183I915_9BILA|nr:unnamed protein product [Soboliphyme baturini]